MTLILNKPDPVGVAMSLVWQMLYETEPLCFYVFQNRLDLWRILDLTLKVLTVEV